MRGTESHQGQSVAYSGSSGLAVLRGRALRAPNAAPVLPAWSTQASDKPCSHGDVSQVLSTAVQCSLKAYNLGDSFRGRKKTKGLHHNALRRQRQENFCEFKADMVYVVSGQVRATE